jgi:hypothetical protein
VRDWRGPIALILAVGVAVAFCSGVVIAEISPNMVTEQETTFFSTLGGAIMGALATYLGVTHINRPNGGNDMETETPERDEPVEPSAPEPEPTEPEPEEAPPPVPPDEESERQEQVEPTPPESEDEEVEAMAGDEDPADL